MRLEDACCPACGQRDVDPRRPMAALLADVLDEVFEVEGRMFRTLRLVFGRPGVLTREYLDGRRQRYTPPLRLYLEVSLLFFVTMSRAAGQELLLEEGETPGTDAPEQAILLAVELRHAGGL